MRAIPGRRVRILALMVGLMVLLSSCTAGAEKKKKAQAGVVAESVMTALKEGDFDSLSTLSGGLFSSDNFIDPDWKGSEETFSAMFDSMTWEFGEVIFYSDTAYTVKVDITHKDLAAAGQAIVDDKEKRVEVFSALVLDYANIEKGIDYTEIPTEYLLDELNNFSKDTVSTGAIELVYDKKEKVWTLDTVPDIFEVCLDYDITVDPTLLLESGEWLDGMMEASYSLATDGNIDLETYRFMYSSVGEKVLETVESLQADEGASGWFDVVAGDFALEYTEGTSQIVYYFSFLKEHPGVEFVCEFYQDDPNNIVYTKEFILTDMPGDLMIIFEAEVTGGLAKGVYGAKVTLADGSVLLQGEIEVK